MFREYDNTINKCHIYLDDSYEPLVLPCIFARYTEILGLKIVRKKVRNEVTGRYNDFIEEKEIGHDAGYKICNHLGRFLEWIDNYTSEEHVSLNTHSAFPPELINTYVNEYLINECNKSEQVVLDAADSLTSYYNFLAYYFDNRHKEIFIKPSLRPIARNNSKRSSHINYLLPSTRELFYRKAETLLHEIVLRNGGDLGCRAKENQGFLLNDFYANKKRYKGLLSLFKELKSNPSKDEFEYHLSSLYTKMGRSRTLYIPRQLLEKMYRYYKTERPKTDSNHLLVSNSNNDSNGRCISKGFPSDVFLQIKSELIEETSKHKELYSNLQRIDVDWSYHTLRHSFGTDLFYNLCEGQNKRIESITTTSSVYIETARRLGHKVDGRGAIEVTKSYIHSCGYRETLLREVTDVF